MFFDLTLTIKNRFFLLEDIYNLKNILKEKHPKNNNIEAKIRQILQQLRDQGLIKFVSSGKYIKLYK
ncbi:MAG: hypothetical protein ACRC5M_07085 [Anaeroplasmataceae bacterium]